MDTWQTPDLINAVVGALALLLGVFAYVRDRAQNAELLEPQQRATRIEESRRREELRAQHAAELRTTIVGPTRVHGVPQLRIQNVGAETASDVQVFVDDVPSSESAHLLLGPNAKRPSVYGPVGPDVHLDLPLWRHGMSPRSYRVRVHWRDGTAEDRRAETVVFMP